MIYRCRACRHEEGMGCLPGVTCGLYALFLVGASSVGMLLAAHVLRWALGVPPTPEGRDAMPWWLGVVAGLAVLFVAAVGAVVINYVLELAEYLFVARRPCPKCGGRRWSRGYTSGFGL